jgi:hypothetical protein
VVGAYRDGDHVPGASGIVAVAVLVLHQLGGSRLVRHFIVKKNALGKTLAIGHGKSSGS